MARRSARLASLSKAPKPPTEPPTLASVAEHNDTPPDVPPKDDKHAANPAVSSPARVPRTPGGSSPVKPPMSEMHPSKVHLTMGPPSSGLRLGFTDIKPASTRNDALPAAVQATPSRINTSSSPFSFRTVRHAPAADLNLSSEAQRMMEGLREEAAKIKAGLIAKREAEKLEEEAAAGGRKIAQPKGKAGRFSAAHMAQFKKMDSIENHPSALRYQPSGTTPLKAGVKRSQSRADLDEEETEYSRRLTPVTAAAENPLATTKRARQHLDDDASSRRPVSRDGSSIPVPKSAGAGIPRSKSNLASLMTPTKSSLARSASVKSLSHGLLSRSPSKATLSGIPRSVTTNHLSSAKPVIEAPASSVKTPRSRFDRVKAMFRGTKGIGAKAKTALPLPSALSSMTPAPPRPQSNLPPMPMTTPGRKLTKHVTFTPETQRAALMQNSPSPLKSCLAQAKTRRELAEVHYPSLDGMMAEQDADAGVTYPDLSARRPLPEPPAKATRTGSTEPSVPGQFTFRSDHTISFGNTTAASFGSSPGQSSIRAVRPSIFLPLEATTTMPGTFPTDAALNSPRSASTVNTTSTASGSNTGSGSGSGSGSNKENQPPRTVYLALPHGMSTKKRHRASTDEEDDAQRDAEQRAAKKRRQEEGRAVPEGEALLAPRLMASASASARGVRSRVLASGGGGSPRKVVGSGAVSVPGTPSPVKRRKAAAGGGGGISLSRLNMLARPKLRK